MDIYLIVALGNPGKSYEKNRHNVGFRAADFLIDSFGFTFKGSRFDALIYDGQIAGKRILLIKPQTFMNLSGKAVLQVFQFYHLSHSHLLSIYDDVDIPFGALRMRAKGSAGTHNGMKSLISELKTSEFPRLRIGIGPVPERWDISDFVLSDFTAEEEAHFDEILSRARMMVETMFSDSVARAALLGQ